LDDEVGWMEEYKAVHLNKKGWRLKESHPFLFKSLNLQLAEILRLGRSNVNLIPSQPCACEGQSCLAGFLFVLRPSGAWLG